MSSLIAKIMSTEDIPDSDTRKLYKLIPVPAGHHVEFMRDPVTKAASLVFTQTYGEMRGALIPLTDCGNVYILQDGKTISSFGVSPYPDAIKGPVRGQVSITAEDGGAITMSGNELSIQASGLSMTVPQSHVIDVTQCEPYIALKANLDFLAPNGVYPWAARWNHLIAMHSVAGFNQATLYLTDEEEAARDSQALKRYFARVRDALLNAKEMIALSWEIRPGEQSVADKYIVTIGGSPVNQIQNLVMTQTHKQNLINYDVNGMVLNNVQRAIKLLNHGAHTVIVSPKLKITEEEITLIKRYFREVFEYSAKFHFEGDLLISMSFDKISPADTAA